MSLLDIEGLGVAFEDEDGHPLPAVQNVSFSLEKGAVTCLVGESGCGKSVLCKSVMKLLPGNAWISGKMLIDGKDIAP